MFGWLFARSPLPAVEKAWIEVHMLWLTEKLGMAQLLAKELPANEQLVSESYQGSAADAQAMLARLCETSRIVSTQFQLQVVGSDCQTQPDVVSLAGPPTIRLSETALANPFLVAASLARELAGHHVPSPSSGNAATEPTPWLVDLTAVCMGWGSIVAHALAEEPKGGGTCGCGPAQPTSWLPPRMMGYALALVAHVRGEAHPPWRTALRLDAQVLCDRAVKYLHRTHDTLFHLDSAGQPFRDRPTTDVLRQLKSGTPSARIAALWELREPRHATLAVQEVGHCLRDSSPTMREEAARTLAVYGPVAQDLVESLLELSEESQSSIRAAAAQALGTAGRGVDDVRVRLAALLRDSDRAVVLQAATALEQYGDEGADAVPHVLEALRGALIRCDHPLIDTVTRTLYALNSDPTMAVLDHFQDDPELREQVVHIIVDALGQQDEGTIA